MWLWLCLQKNEFSPYLMGRNRRTTSNFDKVSFIDQIRKFELKISFQVLVNQSEKRNFVSKLILYIKEEFKFLNT